jgi:hypothetical protein
MAYVLVFLLALIAGGAVAAVTLRNGGVAVAAPGTWTKTYRDREPQGAPAEETRPGRPLPSAPTAHTRVIGLAGLLGAVLVGAGTVAFLAYLAWHMLEGVFS